MPKVLLLLDGDLFLHRTTVSLEREVNWHGDIWSIWTNLDEAKDSIIAQIRNVVDTLGATSVIFCLSDWTGPRFRSLLSPDYKSSRKQTRKPVGYAALRQWALGYFPCSWKPALEADDVMGIMATMPAPEDTKVIIVTDDKDLRQIPGHHYHRDEERVVTPEEGDYWHLLQTLAGDPVDGYKGCPGVGMDTAKGLLDKGALWVPERRTITRGPRKGEPMTDWNLGTTQDPWETVVSCYRKAELTEADALLQARLAKILRYTDWNTEKQEPILWTPKSPVKM